MLALWHMGGGDLISGANSAYKNIWVCVQRAASLAVASIYEGFWWSNPWLRPLEPSSIQPDGRFIHPGKPNSTSNCHGIQRRRTSHGGRRRRRRDGGDGEAQQHCGLTHAATATKQEDDRCFLLFLLPIPRTSFDHF